MEVRNNSDIKLDRIGHQGNSSDTDGIKNEEDKICEGEGDDQNQVKTEDGLRYKFDDFVGANHLQMAK